MSSWRRGAFAFLLLCAALVAQQVPTSTTNSTVTGFLAKSLTVGGIEHRYVLYLPRDYRADRRWPLVVFLNGMGECGTDGWKHIDVGLGPAMRNEPERWPFIVLFPQKPDQASQWIDHDDMVMSMVAATEKECSIDDTQRFLTGLSQGGAGTWAIGAKHKEMWAAIAPVCGYGKPAEVATALKDMPIWAFHGDADPTVLVKETKALVAAVEAAGGKPLTTLYEKVGHNSWDKAYRESGLAEWFLAAPADRPGLWYLADCSRAKVVKVTVRDEMSSDGGPPFQATTTVAFQCTQQGLTWNVERKHRSPEGKDGPEPPPAHGDMDRKNGLQFTSERLQQLLAGGVLALPIEVKPASPKGAVMAWNAYLLEIECQGSAGTWLFRRELPRFALFDPRFEGAARAIAHCVEAVSDLVKVH